MTRSRRLAVSFGSLAVLAAVAIAAVSPAPAADLVPAMTCEELSGVSWGGFILDEVSEVEAGPNDPAHCRVLGTIDEEIHFELLLPTDADWNGRFLMGGGGGYVGSVQNQALQFAGPGLGAEPRVRHGRNGHGPRGLRDRRELGPEPARPRGELRPPGGPRDRGGGEDDHPPLLRTRHRVLVLRRLLAGRGPGHDVVAALSGRLRRHRLRRAGLQLDRPGRLLPPDPAGPVSRIPPTSPRR